jgi:ATP-dependent DNA helicase RecG
MHLPINIDEILRGETVEWERLEFKKGWNPEAVLHTLCAFANDFHNLGGGYIFIGIEEKDGRPLLPPAGIPADEVDRIQKEILALGYRIQPAYHPVIAPYVILDRHVLVLWAPGGLTRPYKAPVSLSKKNLEFAYYIRKASATVRASHQDEAELLTLTATVPFDDRIAHRASLDDLDLALIREYLREAGSALYADAKLLDFPQLCRQMNIVAGPDEILRPLNVGLLFFNGDPTHFFPQTQIDVVRFPEGPGGDVFSEKIFKGPLNRMLRDALAYIDSILIEEIVIKQRGRPEADRFSNYPYEALEEALVNAIYHRSYEIREPVEVRILPDEVTIASYPGPDRSIDMEALRNGRGVTRRYRNRRIGEFLKELNLTEGRGTGIPKILRAIRKNGSPLPRFETDEDRTYFVSRFPIHPKALQRTSKESLTEVEKAEARSGPDGRLEWGERLGLKLGIKLGKNAEMILAAIIQDSHVTAKELSERLGISTTAIDKHIAKLKEYGILNRKGSRKSGAWEVRLNGKDNAEQTELT